MNNQELIEYIQSHLQLGQSLEEITQACIDSGYQQEDIDQAFATLDTQATMSTATAPFSSEQPVSPSTTPSATAPTNRFIPALLFIKRKPLLVGGIAIALILSIGAIIYYFVTTSPQYVLSQAYEKANALKTYNYEFTANITSEQKETYKDTYMPEVLDSTIPYSDSLFGPGKSSFRIDANGVSDNTDINNPKATAIVMLESDIESADGVSFGFDVGLELRTIGNLYYLQLTKTPSSGLFNFSGLTNKWVEIDLEELLEKNATEIEELSDEDVQKLQALLTEYEVLLFEESLPSEPVNDKAMYHYRFTVDKAALKQFIIESLKITEVQPVDEDDIEAIDEFLKQTTFNEVHLWIGKSDKQVHRISTNITVKDGEQGISTEIDFTSTLSEHNEPVRVTAPASSQTIEELMNGWMTSLYGDLYSPALDTPSSPEGNLNRQSPTYNYPVLGDAIGRNSEEASAAAANFSQDLPSQLEKAVLTIDSVSEKFSTLFSQKE